VARGLRAELDPQYVFSAVAGRSVAHFHQHVFARHRGTPDDVGWMDGHVWSGAPRVPSSAIAELCQRLRGYFG
jgi:diadenosine tetraphosphate (Ap4A) HIT family hydrolase